MLVVLISLGVWQVHRLAWKEGILTQIAQAETGPPVPMVGMIQAPTPYSKVAVTGRFREDLSALYGDEVRQTPDGVRMGAQLIVPLVRKDAPTAAGGSRLGAADAPASHRDAGGRGDGRRLCAPARPARPVQRA